MLFLTMFLMELRILMTMVMSLTIEQMVVVIQTNLLRVMVHHLRVVVKKNLVRLLIQNSNHFLILLRVVRKQIVQVMVVPQ